jgi:hypothetical protein
MSGIKDVTVTMTRTERDRLIRNATGAAETVEQMRRREQTAQFALNAANMKLDTLNSTLNNEITGLHSEMRQMANEQNRRLREQSAEYTRRLQEQDAAFNHSIADVNRRMENQKIALNNLINEVRQRAENNRRELQSSIDSINAKIEAKEKNSRKLAIFWVDQARAYFGDISQYRHDLFTPGELEKLRSTLDLVISSKVDEAIIGPAILVFRDAVDLKEKVVNAEMEWACYNTRFQQALANTKSNLDYHKTMQFTFATEDGDETVDANINYWTEGALDSIGASLAQIEQRAAQTDGLSTQELIEMTETLNHINTQMELEEGRAKEALISSQFRAEMADKLARVLIDRGWTCQEGDCVYEGGEYNEKVHVKLSDIKGNEIVAVISPDENLANNVEINFFNKDNDEGFRQTQLVSILESLKDDGLNVGEPVCRKGFETQISNNDAIRDIQATATKKVQATARKTAQTTKN